MNSLTNTIKRFAELLVFANLIDNFKDTWKKMEKDPDRFKQATDPFIKRYLETHTSVKDINEVRNAIHKATEEEITLSFDRGKWTTKPKGRPALQPFSR